MRLLVGIGNPGPSYLLTRHNAGFMVCDLLAQRHGLAWERQKRWKALIAPWREAPGGPALLIKPQTFVNLSGACVQGALAFHKLEPSALLVLVDDLHLTLGHLRLRAEGSAGGHNGLRDIEARLGQAYARLRLGIGAPGPDQIDHVLGRFSDEEQQILPRFLARAADCATSWLAEGAAAQRFNGPLPAETG